MKGDQKNEGGNERKKHLNVKKQNLQKQTNNNKIK